MWTRRKFLEAATSGAALAATSLDSLHASVPAEQPSARKKMPLQAPKAPVDAAKALLSRQIGEHAHSFDLQLISAENGHEVYELSASGGRVTVAGSTAVAIARGIYSYLRESCHCMITWSGAHIDMPAQLPDVEKHRVVCPYEFTQYLNPCCFGYTMPFWDWARWERELDWMALHGINMPLALEGQEIIWNKVWLDLGLTQAELDQFSVGPAHLPWHRMGNINNFDGPLPMHFMEKKRDLQRKILDRMRELGMKPVAPAFAGLVPQGFKRVHPEAETFTELWFADYAKSIPRSTRTFILHPNQDALYREIGKRFIEAYKEEYGEVQYYLADTFNELDVPVSTDHRYEDLARFSKTVFESIQAGDPNGIWVMQSWFLVAKSKFWDNASVEAFYRNIPTEKVLIIDYANDVMPEMAIMIKQEQWKVQKAFFGKRWMNGMVHTFGGNNTVKGNLRLIASQPASVLESPDRGKLVGWAICPEGFEANEVVYELMTDIGWKSTAINLKTWIPAYCRARYGECPPAMLEAWELLLTTAYSTHTWMTKQAWQTEPSEKPTAHGVDSSPDFQKAVRLFLSCSSQLGKQDLYRNDLIELVVQAAGGQVDKLLVAAIASEAANDKPAATEQATAAMKLLRRMDGLMNLREDRRLERWVNGARSYAASEDQAAFHDENGRRLITVWGWAELSDYATRVWSGLMRDYYAPRWEQWFGARFSGVPVSLDVWEQTWLSSSYRPSQPILVTDLIEESARLLG